MSDEYGSAPRARLNPLSRIVWRAGGALILPALLGLQWIVDSAVAQTATPAPPPVTVSAPLQRSIVEWDEYTGQFAAVDRVELRARVSGYLTEIHFQDGDIVKLGDLLFAGRHPGIRCKLLAAECVPRAVVEADATRELRSLHGPVPTRLAPGDVVPTGVGLGAEVVDGRLRDDGRHLGDRHPP